MWDHEIFNMDEIFSTYISIIVFCIMFHVFIKGWVLVHNPNSNSPFWFFCLGTFSLGFAGVLHWVGVSMNRSGVLQGGGVLVFGAGLLGGARLPRRLLGSSQWHFFIGDGLRGYSFLIAKKNRNTVVRNTTIMVMDKNFMLNQRASILLSLNSSFMK